MIIAVNTKSLPVDFPAVYRDFIYETFKRIVGNNSDHHFIFIFDRKQDKPFITAPNVTEVVTGPVAKYPLLWKFWFNSKIPAVLKKYKVDVFVSGDGICSLSSKVPQCIVLHDLAFLQTPLFIKKTHVGFFKKNTSKFLSRAKVVVTTSNLMKQTIAADYDINAAGINVIPGGVNENFLPVKEEENSRIKNKYTEGKEFFLFAGNIHPVNNILNLLKAFSVLKKRHQTGMKLLLAGKLSPEYSIFRKSLASYKYRNDVVWIEEIAEKELQQIVASAYCLIDISFYQGFNADVLQAMRCDVPVITSEESTMQELTNGAALYADTNDIDSVADKMKLLYKDENLRKELIIKGQSVATGFNWDKTADLFWKSICKAIG